MRGSPEWACKFWNVCMLHRRPPHEDGSESAYRLPGAHASRARSAETCRCSGKHRRCLILDGFASKTSVMPVAWIPTIWLGALTHAWMQNGKAHVDAKIDRLCGDAEEEKFRWRPPLCQGFAPPHSTARPQAQARLRLVTWHDPRGWNHRQSPSFLAFFACLAFCATEQTPGWLGDMMWRFLQQRRSGS